MRQPLESDKQISLWPLAVLGLVVSALSLFTSKRNQSGESVPPQDSTERKNPDAQGQTTLAANISLAPPNSGSADGDKKKTPLWEKFAVLIALGLLVVNICQMRSTEKQTTLLRQQLEGTEAANLKVEIFHKLADAPHVVISISNIGHIIGRGIYINFVVTRRTLPEEQVIETFSPNWNFSIVEMSSQDPTHSELYALKLSPQQIQAIEDTKETIRVEGNITYNNGFDNQIRPVCSSILAVQFRNKIGALSGNSEGMFSCSEFPSRVRLALQEKENRKTQN